MSSPIATIPTTVDIFGSTWRIVFCDLLTTSGNLGMSHSDTQTIRIDEGLAPGQQRETLIHELIHAIICSILDGDNRTEHSIVYTTSQGLWHVYVHNPELWAWLFPGGDVCLCPAPETTS